jgi:hypothetical protein
VTRLNDFGEASNCIVVQVPPAALQVHNGLRKRLNGEWVKVAGVLGRFFQSRFSRV